MAVQDFDFGIICVERSDIRIVLPQFRAAGANIGEELIRITFVQVAEGGCEHDEITGRLIVDENQLLHASIASSLVLVLEITGQVEDEEAVQSVRQSERQSGMAVRVHCIPSIFAVESGSLDFQRELFEFCSLGQWDGNEGGQGIGVGAAPALGVPVSE